MQYKPTLKSEFLRGLNFYNISVGLISSIAIAAVFFAGVHFGFIANIPQEKAFEYSVIITTTMFLLTTALHTAAHSYFGWRFAKGINASLKGDHVCAVKLLQVVEQRGMDHYDIESHARRFLEESRKALEN